METWLVIALGALVVIILAVFIALVVVATRKVKVFTTGGMDNTILNGIVTPKTLMRCSKYEGAQNAYTIHGFLNIHHMEGPTKDVKIMSMMTNKTKALADLTSEPAIKAKSIKCSMLEDDLSEYKAVHSISFSNIGLNKVVVKSKHVGIAGDVTASTVESNSILINKDSWTYFAVQVERYDDGVFTHTVYYGDADPVMKTADVGDRYQGPASLIVLGDTENIVKCADAYFTVAGLRISDGALDKETLDKYRTSGCIDCAAEAALVPSCDNSAGGNNGVAGGYDAGNNKDSADVGSLTQGKEIATAAVLGAAK